MGRVECAALRIQGPSDFKLFDQAYSSCSRGPAGDNECMEITDTEGRDKDPERSWGVFSVQVRLRMTSLDKLADVMSEA